VKGGQLSQLQERSDEATVKKWKYERFMAEAYRNSQFSEGCGSAEKYLKHKSFMVF
jgi:hypothetical protein